MGQKHWLIGICVVILFLSPSLLAQQAGTRPIGRDLTASRLITFNGTLKDSNGQPRPGNVGITFALYASQEGGTALWQESQSVQTDEQGRYTIFLGATEKEGLPLEVFSSGKAQWLGVQVQGEEEQPRVLLVAVPYALKAADADTVGGRPLSSFVLYEDLAKIIEKQVTPAMIVAQSAAQGPGLVAKQGPSGAVGGGFSDERKLAVSGSSGPPRVSAYETNSNTGYGLSTAAQTIGSHNSYFGYSAGSSATSPAAYNSIFGSNAGYSNGTASENSYFGYDTGYYSTGSDNAMFGFCAGCWGTTGSYNSLFGAGAAQWLGTGANNSIFGRQAGYYIGAGSNNALFGRQAGYNNTANENSFFGTESGYSNTSATGNSFFGFQAGRANQTGASNSFFGYRAGLGNTGGNNSFFGNSAGTANTSGTLNSFFGAGAGISNTTGYWNNFVGYQSGFSNTTGNGNNFVGYLSGYAHVSDGGNTYVGDQAGKNEIDGATNSFFGAQAGLSVTHGRNDTLLGAFSNGAAAITNATAIGYAASVTQSNSLVLGSINGVNGGPADTNVGIGTTAPGGKLHVKGGANEIFYVGTNGLIGIGTAAPDRKLHIAGGALGNAELHIGGAGDELHDVFSGMGVDVSTGPAFNYGYSGSSFGRSSGFFNVRPDPSAIAPNPSLRFMTVNQQRMIITNTGNVGIGTSAPTEKLHVVGNFRLSGTIITGAPEEPVPDYVFEPGYKLMPIEDLQKYLQKERHLPSVPTSGEIRENGLNLGQFQMKLLEKIEELTLYTLEQAKTNQEQKAALERRDAEIAALTARLASLERMIERPAKQVQK